MSEDNTVFHKRMEIHFVGQYGLSNSYNLKTLVQENTLLITDFSHGSSPPLQMVYNFYPYKNIHNTWDISNKSDGYFQQ